MDVKTTLCAYENPVNTRRYLDVDSTLFERYERQMDVKTTLCAYEETFVRDSSTSVNTMTRVVMRRGFWKVYILCEHIQFQKNTRRFKDIPLMIKKL